MGDAPTGTVTFLFSDIEGSTRRWEEQPDAMRDALALHDALLGRAIATHRGRLVKTTGDGVLAAFSTAAAGVAAALDGQRALRGAAWGAVGELRVRMAVHTGAAELDGNDYHGPAVNRAARLMATGHGGQVLVSRSTEELVRDVLPPDVSLVDLGEHRLRDLSRSERIFQAEAPGVEGTFPPLRSLDSLPTNLPVQLTSFVGREEELPALREVLQGHRLVTITGVGGVGKTRLALQLAADVLTDFPDGVWLCELAAAEEGGAVAEVVATALGAPARPSMTPAVSVAEFLRARHLLVVLDNCEHVLDGAAVLVEEILTTCPRVRVVATSREGLGVAGEQLHPVRSLAAGSATDLFADRAALATPGFVVDAGDAVAVEEICRRLDGIPLAIELAAARVASMSPTEIAALLDERFRLLTGGRRRSVERHHTLRATVDWSYALLSEVDRTVFARLGVFAGGFDAAAARAVAAGGDIDELTVLDALSELVAKSMVVAGRSGRATRYTLLETLRQYALEHLATAGEADASRRRHARHYAGFAERIGPLLLGPDEAVWRPRLEDEIDNLRLAVGWGLEGEEQEDVELAMRTLAGIEREAVLSRHLGIGGWAERAILIPGAQRSPLLPGVLVIAAYGCFHRGDAAATERLATEVLDVDPDSSWASMALANVLAQRGELAEAIAVLADAAGRTAGGSYDEHALYAVLAIYRGIAGDGEGARVDAARAVDAARGLGQPSALSLAHYSRGLCRWRSDPAAARADFEESLRLVDRGASGLVVANTHAALGTLCFDEGDLSAAAVHVRESIMAFDRSGDRPPMAGSLAVAIRLLLRWGRLDAAAVAVGAVLDGCFASMVWLAETSGALPSAELDQLRASMAPDAYEAARRRGAALTYEQAVAHVLAELGE